MSLTVFLALAFEFAQEKMRERTLTQTGVTAVCFSPDAKYLASAGTDEIVRIWDVVDRKEIAKLRFGGKKGGPGLEDIRKLLFLPDGESLVIAGGWDTGPARFHVWAIEVGEVQTFRHVHQQQVRTLCASAKMMRLYSTDIGGSHISQWQLGLQSRMQEDDEGKARIGTFMAIASCQGFSLLEEKYLYQSVAATPGGKVLYLGGDHISLYDVATKKANVFRETNHEGMICSITAHPTLPCLAYAGGDGFTVWILGPKQKWKTVRGGGRCTHVQFSHDGKKLAVLRGGVLSLLGFPDLQGPTIRRDVLAVDFSSDGRWMAIGAKTGLRLRKTGP